LNCRGLSARLDSDSGIDAARACRFIAGEFHTLMHSIHLAVGPGLHGLQFGFEHLTPPGMAICGVLVFLSVISWTAVLAKWMFLRRSEKANRRFLEKYRASPQPLALYLTRERVEQAPMYHIYHEACRELAFYLVGEEEPGRAFSSRLQGAGRINASQMSAVHVAMERAVAAAATRLEARIGFVATALSAAPLLGLLGTVWGILEVFAALASGEAAPTVAALAPGIASALITTLLALLVALPSLVCYNGLAGRIRRMVVRLDNFAADLNGMLDRHFVDHHAPDESLPSLGGMGAPSLSVHSQPPGGALASMVKLSAAS